MGNIKVIRNDCGRVNVSYNKSITQSRRTESLENGKHKYICLLNTCPQTVDRIFESPQLPIIFVEINFNLCDMNRGNLSLESHRLSCLYLWCGSPLTPLTLLVIYHSTQLLQPAAHQLINPAVYLLRFFIHSSPDICCGVLGRPRLSL